MKLLMLCILCAMLAGCSATTAYPEVYLSENPIEVTDDNIGQYWTRQNETFSFSLPLNRQPKVGEQGHVKIRFLIDSNGNTFNAEIIESVPEGLRDYAGVKAITKQSFVPSDSNISRIPVYITQTITFK